MKIKEFQHKPVQPDTYEASMALQQLMRIAKCGMKLHNMIDNDAEMESWVAKKIDIAGDYVKKVYNDGKIDLRRDAFGRSRIPEISTTIIEKLQNSEGMLPYNDTSSPASIRAEFNTSKKAFKQALSTLYKNRKILITKDGIQLVVQEEHIG